MSRTGYVGFVLGARDAAFLGSLVAVEGLDRFAVGGLVSLRAVGAGYRLGCGRCGLDAARYEFVACGAALFAEIRRRATRRRHSDSGAPRRLVSVLAA